MPRWIVFYQVTSSALRSRLPQATVFEAPGRGALEYALENLRNVITVLPPGTIAVFRPGSIQPAPPTTKASPVRATGILGLSDAPAPEEENAIAEKRKWWQFWR